MLIMQQSSPTVMGIPSVWIQIALSIFVPLAIFGSTLFAQYLTNRRRDIKKLNAYKTTLEYIINELIKWTEIQDKFYDNTIKGFPDIKGFALPTARFTFSKNHLMDTIDKKEIFTLINRWTKDNLVQIQNLLDILKLSNNISDKIEEIRTKNDEEYVKPAKERRQEWDIKMKEFQKMAYRLQANPASMGLTKNEKDWIISLMVDKEIKKEFVLEKYMVNVVWKILENKELFKVGSRSNTPDFIELWTTLNQLSQIATHFRHSMHDCQKMYIESSKRMKVYHNALTKTLETLNQMKIKKSFGF